MCRHFCLPLHGRAVCEGLGAKPRVSRLRSDVVGGDARGTARDFGVAPDAAGSRSCRHPLARLRHGNPPRRDALPGECSERLVGLRVVWSPNRGGLHPVRRFGRRRHDDTERPHGPRLQVAGAEALIPTAPGRAPERPRSAATLAPDAEAHLNRRSTWATGWGQITRGAHDRRSVAVPNCRTGIFSLRAYGALFKL